MAIADLAQAMDMDPKSFAPHFLTGKALLKLNRTGDAIEAFLRAFALTVNTVQVDYFDFLFDRLAESAGSELAKDMQKRAAEARP